MDKDAFADQGCHRRKKTYGQLGHALSSVSEKCRMQDHPHYARCLKMSRRLYTMRILMSSFCHGDCHQRLQDLRTSGML
jgi:hypothetical protein